MALREDFNQLIQNKKAEFDNITDPETVVRKNAEYLFILEWTRNNAADIDAGNENATNVYNAFLNNNFEQFEEQVQGYVTRINNFWDAVDVEERIRIPDQYQTIVNPNVARLSRNDAALFRNKFLRDYHFHENIYKPGVPVPDEKMEAINRDLNIAHRTIDDEWKPMCDTFEPAADYRKLFENIGFSTDRKTSHVSTMMMYLIAKKNFTLEQAINFNTNHERYAELMGEFKTFLEQHPTKTQVVENYMENGQQKTRTVTVPVPEAEENLKEWRKLFLASSKALETYRYPDIDYNDPEQRAQHHYMLIALATFAMDVRQEADKMIQNNTTSLAGLPGFRQSFDNASPTLQNLINFCATYRSAYTWDERHIGFSNAPIEGAKLIAVNRAMLNYLAPRYAGKVAGEIFNGEDRDEFLLDEMMKNNAASASLMDRDFKIHEVTGYLRNGDQRFLNTFNNKLEGWKSYCRNNQTNKVFEKTERLFLAPIRQWSENPEFEVFLNEIFDSEKTPEQMVSLLRNGLEDHPGSDLANRRKEFVDNIEKLFRSIVYYSPNQEIHTFNPQVNPQAGQRDENGNLIMTDPLSDIRIDGQTPEEKWGRKYQSINDPEERRRLYHMEIVREALQGDSHITLRHFGLDAQGKVTECEPMDLILDHRTFERRRVLLNEINDFHNYIGDLQTRFDSFETVPETAQLRQRVRENLNRVYTASDITGNSNFEMLKDAWKDYYDAVNEFYTAHYERLEEPGRNTPARTLKRVRSFMKKEWNEALERISRVEGFAVNQTKISPAEIQEKNNPKYSFKNLLARGKDYSNLRQWGNNVHTLGGRMRVPAERVIHMEEIRTNPAKFEEFKKYTRMPIVPDAENKYSRHAEVLLGEKDQAGFRANEETYENLGLNTNEASMQSLFVLWLMENKNLSIKQAVPYACALNTEEGQEQRPEYEESMRYLQEFDQFLKANPFALNPERSREQVEENVEEWGKLFAGFSKKMEEYKLPEIDFSDPEQVVKHYEELSVLANLTRDVPREFNRLLDDETNNKYRSARKIAQWHFDGEKGLWNAVVDFERFKAFGAYFQQAYLHDPSSRVEVGSIAASRALFAEEFNAFGGVPLSRQRMVRPIEEACSEQLLSDTIFRDIPFAEATSYLQGYNCIPFKNRVKGYAAEKKAAIRKERSVDLMSESFTEYRKRHWDDEVTKKVSSIGDSAEDMQRFLNEPFVGEYTGTDWVDREMELLFNANYRGVLYSSDIDLSDAVLIDGQTVEDKFGHKYEDVLNGNEKEMLYRAEILKAIAKGESRIKFRMFNYTNENMIEDIDPVTIYLPRRTMLKIADSETSYQQKKKHLLEQLKRIKTRLRNTQSDKTKNFDGLDKEGSDSYKEFTNAIEYAIRIFAQDNRNTLEYRSALHALERYANAYYMEHNKWNKAWRDNGKIRLEEAERLRDGVVRAFDSWRDDFEHLSLYSSKGKLASEETENVIDDIIRDVVTGIKGERPDPLEDEDRYVRGQIRQRLNRIKNSDSFKEAMALPETDPKRIAVTYLSSYFDNLLDEKSGEKKLLKQADLSETECFWDTVPVLAANPTFLRYMKEDPEGCIAGWRSKVCAGADRLRDENERELRNKRLEFGNLGRFIAGKKRDDEPAERQHLTLSDYIRENEDLMITHSMVRDSNREMYVSRLTEVIVNQMLSQENAEADRLRQQIVRGERSVDELKEYVYNRISDGNMLTPDKVTGTMRKLEDRSLQASLRKDWEALQVVADQTKQRTGEEQIKQVKENFSWINNVDRLTEEQYNALNNVAVLEAANEFDREFDRANDRLTMPLFTTVKKQIGGKETSIPKRVQLTQQDLTNANLLATRPEARQADFIIWTMGKHNMSLEDAVKICNVLPVENENHQIENAEELAAADKLRCEYAEFVKANAVVKLSEHGMDEEVEAALKNWAGVYKTATEKMKEFRIPDINYRDMNEVKEKLPVLYAAAHVSISVGQDYQDKIMGYAHNGGKVSGERIFAKELGGEAQLRKATGFWWTFGSMIHPFERGFLQAPNKNNILNQNAKNELSLLSVYRKTGEDNMQMVKGLTAGQATEVYRKSGKQYTEKDNALLFNVINVSRGGVPGANLKSAVSFLNGTDRKAMEAIADKMNRDATRENEPKLSLSINMATTDFALGFNFEGMKEDLTSIPQNDAEAMIEFSRGTTPDGKKVKDWMSNQIHRLSSSYPMLDSILQDRGMDYADLFYIDGQSVKERFSDKYKDIPEGDEKNSLYMLEFIKELAHERYPLSAKTFKMKNGIIEEDDPVIVKDTPENYKKLCDSVHAYKSVVHRILNELKIYKQEFQNTQNGHPEYNFDGDPPVRSGSAEYQEMTGALQNCIVVMDKEEKGNSNTVEVMSALTRLQNAAREYERTHEGGLKYLFQHGNFFSTNSPRFTYSKLLQTNVARYRNRLNKISHAYSKRVGLLNGHTFADADYGQILPTVQKAEEVYDFPVENEDYYKKVAAKTIVDEDAIYMLSVKEPEKFNIYTPQEKAQYHHARSYLTEMFRNKRRIDTLTDKDMLLFESNDVILAKLEDDPVFQTFYYEDPEATIQNWETYEDTALEQKQFSQMQVNEIKRWDPPVAYMAGLPVNQPGQQYTMEQVNNKTRELFANAHTQQERNSVKEQLISGAARLITHQILSGDSKLSRNIRLTIASGRMTIDEFQTNVRDYFIHEKGGLFTNANKAVETLKDINDGTAYDTIVDRIEENIAEVNYSIPHFANNGFEPEISEIELEVSPQVAKQNRINDMRRNLIPNGLNTKYNVYINNPNAGKPELEEINTDVNEINTDMNRIPNPNQEQINEIPNQINKIPNPINENLNLNPINPVQEPNQINQINPVQGPNLINPVQGPNPINLINPVPNRDQINLLNPDLMDAIPDPNQINQINPNPNLINQINPNPNPDPNLIGEFDENEFKTGLLQSEGKGIELNIDDVIDDQLDNFENNMDFFMPDNNPDHLSNNIHGPEGNPNPVNIIDPNMRLITPVERAAAEFNDAKQKLKQMGKGSTDSQGNFWKEKFDTLMFATAYVLLKNQNVKDIMGIHVQQMKFQLEEKPKKDALIEVMNRYSGEEIVDKLENNSKQFAQELLDIIKVKEQGAPQNEELNNSRHSEDRKLNNSRLSEDKKSEKAEDKKSEKHEDKKLNNSKNPIKI